MSLQRFWSTLAALVLFGVSFGFVEAAVVQYLRFVWQPLQARAFPDVPVDAIFPLLRLEELHDAGQGHVRILGTELIREVATLVMVWAVALAMARNPRQWVAGFMIVFGVWDVLFYSFLKVLLDWPESVFTWDLLFLLPVPWVGPVCAPLMVSAAMIAAGSEMLMRERLGRPIRFFWQPVLAIGSGGLTVVVA